MSNVTFLNYYKNIFEYNSTNINNLYLLNESISLIGYEHKMDKIYDTLSENIDKDYSYLKNIFSLLYKSTKRSHNLIYCFYLLDVCYIGDKKMYIDTLKDWYELIKKPIELQFLIYIGKIFFVLNNFNEKYDINFNMKNDIPEYNKILDKIEMKYKN